MKKIMVIVLVLAMALGTASFAFAADPPYGIFGGDPPQLKITDGQKAQMTSFLKQMMEVKKQIFQQNVENGTITEEQSKLMEDRMNSKLEAMQSGEWGPGMGRHAVRHRGPEGQRPQAQ